MGDALILDIVVLAKARARSRAPQSFDGRRWVPTFVGTTRILRRLSLMSVTTVRPAGPVTLVMGIRNSLLIGNVPGP
jgi:hypothetical protein